MFSKKKAITSNNLMKSPSLDLKNTVKLELQISMLHIPKSSEDNSKKKELAKRNWKRKRRGNHKKVAKPCGTLLN